jgi:hypothetical protein
VTPKFGGWWVHVRGALGAALVLASAASCGGGKSSAAGARYPARPPGCSLKVFHIRAQGIAFEDIGRVDAICSTDIHYEDCLAELKNQACKLGGDILYDVPDEPDHPSPDKNRLTGRVAHSRAGKKK